MIERKQDIEPLTDKDIEQIVNSIWVQLNDVQITLNVISSRVRSIAKTYNINLEE